MSEHRAEQNDTPTHDGDEEYEETEQRSLWIKTRCFFQNWYRWCFWGSEYRKRMRTTKELAKKLSELTLDETIQLRDYLEEVHNNQNKEKDKK